MSPLEQSMSFQYIPNGGLYNIIERGQLAQDFYTDPFEEQNDLVDWVWWEEPCDGNGDTGSENSDNEYENIDEDYWIEKDENYELNEETWLIPSVQDDNLLSNMKLERHFEFSSNLPEVECLKTKTCLKISRGHRRNKPKNLR